MEWTGDARLAAGPEATWYLETAFTPGKHLGTVYDDPTTPVVVTGIEEVTAIRIPSGRLVVDAPWHDDETWEYERGLPTSPPRELAVRIPPGTYRVEIAWTAGPYEFFGEHFDSVACAATRLCISEDLVVGWEMGLGVDDDIDRLQPGEQIRFGSDANVGCFADAGAWMALTAPFRAYVDGRPVPRDSVQLPGWCERVTDESQQADLVTFTAESGGVVWLGRTKTGDVAAIVVTSGMPGAKA
ncbi:MULTISPECIES: DUF4241 domain-containing protein [unclassified Streptomyces]|uniref:DUF4241 domain-containing protein n=1 Tax=unclassified Streptomyces TaxID=2593676 RepID=UPI002E8084C0|nr:DUF4241 domain-containing protein [Streptomyces sp. NBC_00562]WUC23247.1 DUF4241 domain-containing protein [Streptomyces sp. NBC_00562]